MTNGYWKSKVLPHNLALPVINYAHARRELAHSRVFKILRLAWLLKRPRHMNYQLIGL